MSFGPTDPSIPHDAFCTYTARDRVVHQLRPMYGVNMSTGKQSIVRWHYRYDSSMGILRAKHGTDVVTCLTCLAWRGSTEPFA